MVQYFETAKMSLEYQVGNETQVETMLNSIKRFVLSQINTIMELQETDPDADADDIFIEIKLESAVVT